jgi:hypothetical protein
MRSIVTDKALNIVIKPPMSAPLSFAKKGLRIPSSTHALNKFRPVHS